MKKCLIFFFIIQSTIVIAQEIYVAGCIYENDKPIPVYWVNNEVEILGKPIGTFGEATDIILYNDNILVFGYLILDRTERKIPVLWRDKLTFDILYYPEWRYKNCTIKNAYVFNDTVYVLGYLEDTNGHYGSIIWRNFSNYYVIKVDYYNTIILDMELIDNSVIAAGYIQDYNGFSKNEYVYNVNLNRESRKPFSQKLQEINIIRVIGEDTFYCGRINNQFVVIKNDTILYKDELYQESIIYDIMMTDHKLFILAYVNDGVNKKLLYGESTFPNIVLSDNRIISSGEIVGLRGNEPIIIFSEWKKENEYEKQQFGIILNNRIIELGF